MDDIEGLSKRFYLVPLVGLFYGLIAGLAFYLLTQVFNNFVAAVIVVLVVHSLNRFLHFDGLIDLGDGLIATGTQEKKRGAMKDTRVGAGGVSFGIMFTLLLVGALSSVWTLLIFAPLAMEVLAKNSLLCAAAFGKEREGLGSPFVKNTGPESVAASIALSLLILFPASLLLVSPTYGLGDAAIIVLSMTAASLICGWLMAKLAMRSFGCVNGDVLGATNEISKAVVLLTFLGVIGWLL
jgi:adenosylcobinamide-GDP ribazoletransferase